MQYQDNKNDFWLNKLSSKHNIITCIDDSTENMGITDISFILKTFLVCFVIFIFLGILALLPITKIAPVIITEKKIISEEINEINKKSDLSADLIYKKKNAIAAVNEEIKKLNEKKMLADSLKLAKKELLVLSAEVDDGYMTREIIAKAEVDSITNDEIDLLSKSLQTTVDSIALQAKLDNYLAKQKQIGSNILFSLLKGNLPIAPRIKLHSMLPELLVGK